MESSENTSVRGVVDGDYCIRTGLPPGRFYVAEFAEIDSKAVTGGERAFLAVSVRCVEPGDIEGKCSFLGCVPNPNAMMPEIRKDLYPLLSSYNAVPGSTVRVRLTAATESDFSAAARELRARRGEGGAAAVPRAGMAQAAVKRRAHGSAD